MDLINDLGTDLALAFLVEQRYRQRLDSAEALALIDRVRDLLESSPVTSPAAPNNENPRSFSAH